MLTRRLFLSSAALAISSAAFAQDQPAAVPEPDAGAQPDAGTESATPDVPAVKVFRLALVASQAGDDYFESCRDGALQAVAEVENAQMTFSVPPTADGAQQAALVDDFVAQGYDAILISPVPSDVVIASCQKAISAGLKVISFGTALPPDARHLHLRTPDVADAAPMLLQTINTALNKAGEVAIVSTAPERGDHQGIAKALQREWLKPDYSDLALITTVYGHGDVKRSYAETLAIVQAYPNLRGIIAPDASAMAGALQAVRDLGKGANIKLTGVGLPSKLAGLVREGTVPGFVTWSPIDVGYAAARIALSVLRNEEAILSNAPIRAGRLGELVVDQGGVAKVGQLVTVDATSIDKYAEQF